LADISKILFSETNELTDPKVTYLSLYFLVWWKSLHDKINLIAKRRYIENIQNMVDKNSMNI
jgi:hypothetical protein